MFASLMDPHSGGDGDGESISRDLEIISLVGCSISTVAVLLTVGVTLFLWRFIKKPRTQTIILLNLCAAIDITCTLVIGETWARKNEASCTVVAALLHYSLLAMFSWMLCEGILLYNAVMKMTVGGVQETPKYFYAIGWGFPAIVVAVSLGVTKTSGYGTADVCWLSTGSGLIWAFIGPASVVILVNIVVFILVLRQRASTRAERNKDRVDKIRSGIRASVVILPILGVTWVFGLLSFNEDTLAFKYIFTILNSLQGLVIFIFHCVLNKKIHDAIKRWADKRNRMKHLTIGKHTRRKEDEFKLEAVGDDSAAVAETEFNEMIQELQHTQGSHLSLTPGLQYNKFSQP